MVINSDLSVHIVDLPVGGASSDVTDKSWLSAVAEFNHDTVRSTSRTVRHT